MRKHSDYLILFNYPENRDKTISNFGLKVFLALFLIYACSKQTDFLGHSVFIFFISIIVIQTYIELKTFYAIDQVGLLNDALVLLKNKTIKSKTLFSNLAFIIRSNPIDLSNNITIDFYAQDSKKHLINLRKNDLNGELFHEFIEELVKLSNRDKEDFLMSSGNQLLSFSIQYMNEQTMKGEFIKHTKQAFFTKYNFLVILFITIIVLSTLHILRQ
ncbi:hypothetical protein [Sulfurimonas sp.]